MNRMNDSDPIVYSTDSDEHEYNLNPSLAQEIDQEDWDLWWEDDQDC